MSKPDTKHDAAELQYSLRHLQAELARIDVLIGSAVRRWQLAGRDPADAFSGLHISDEEAEAWLLRPFATSWGQNVALDADEREHFSDAYELAVRQVAMVLEAIYEHGVQPRFERLVTAFDLNAFEREALLICLAPALDRRYERLYGYLQDDVTRTWPSINLILDLLCDPGVDRLQYLAYFQDDRPLRARTLIQPVEGERTCSSRLAHMLAPDETIVAWLTGAYQPHAEIRDYTTLQDPSDIRLYDRRLAASVQATIEQAAEGDTLIVFHGPDRIMQWVAARVLAVTAGQRMLSIDLAGAVEAGVSPQRALTLVLRDAHLLGAIPYFTGWDTTLVDGAPPADLLETLCAHPDLVVTAGTEQWQPRGIRRDRRVLTVAFPVPAYTHRQTLWSYFLAEGETDEKIDTAGLAGQFRLTTGQIRDVVASATDTAAQRGEAVTNEDLFAAARAHSNPRLSTLARKIVPRYEWDDIVLPDDQRALLRELVTTVRNRPIVLDDWGLGKKLVASAGITCLFSGPPGTGKTMAAEVIAAELGLDLYKIDLSSVVSKYIGETEKNLEKIFNEAQSSNAILFFDEADAIFGKRSEVKDAHDRYANVEVSYLLQRMEAYDGVTILATNLRANLDEAFTRRLQFAIDFPFPDKQYRRRIWETLFPPDVPREEDIDFARFADRFKLAGGNIRNIIVGAAYLAAADGGRVTREHLLHSTRRELQKMGRLVNERDLRMP